MTCFANAAPQSRPNAATATIALVAAGYLMTSSTTAQQASEADGEARSGGWLTQIWRGAAQPRPAANQVETQSSSTTNSSEVPKSKSADTNARKRRKGEEKEDLFLPG